MLKGIPGALVMAFWLSLFLIGCGDGGDNAANPTPPENISEAEPEGAGGTSND